MLADRYLPKDLYRGTTLFVTGGGSGINFGIARTFAMLGASVGLCGRTQLKLDGAAEQLRALGAQVHAQVADVRDYGAVEAALTATREALGPIGVLVCGAAGNFPIPAEKLSPNGFKTVVDIDLLGSFNAARACFDQLKQTRGTVIFISAGMSYVPYPYQVHVGAAKAGIDMMMRNLALEWGRHGIRANSIVPGPIADTEGMRRLGGTDDIDEQALGVPLGRYGTVEEIGAAAAFLASPLAQYMTGSMMVVDGGSNLLGSVPFAQAIERAGGNPR